MIDFLLVLVFVLVFVLVLVCVFALVLVLVRVLSLFEKAKVAGLPWVQGVLGPSASLVCFKRAHAAEGTLNLTA